MTGELTDAPTAVTAVTAVTAATAASDATAATGVTAVIARPRLLIVDDQPLNIRLLHQVFQADFEVFVATSGEGALSFCQTQLPDVILLDVQMPGLDGYEVCRRLKRDPRTGAIPVVFVTSQSDTSEEEDGLAAGAADFIARSASANVMRARVNTLMILKRQTDQLRSIARIDALTGLANRRDFDERLEIEWRRCARAARPLALIMIDIDYFKLFNDCYGHQAGDACLRKVARSLKAQVNRSPDMLARYGGEEFVCVLPETPLAGAHAKAHALEAAVRALGIPHARTLVLGGIVTISLGVAVVVPKAGDDYANLVLCADRSLYLAKDAGRGQVRALQS
jgi:diguanylate cyclase (GGDEF)-like protein